MSNHIFLSFQFLNSAPSHFSKYNSLNYQLYCLLKWMAITVTKKFLQLMNLPANTPLLLLVVFNYKWAGSQKVFATSLTPKRLSAFI